MLFSCSLCLLAQGTFPPAASKVGTTAMHKDSSAFKDWANKCIVIRGPQDIRDSNSDTAYIGFPSSALGKADGNNVVSLGDGGEAVVQFASPVYNGVGPDFAVFENAFNSTFLELAFVEVSSDGTNYFRFPAESLTDTTKSVGSFGSIEASDIHNLAGKYQSNYGTPFDLEDLIGIAGLDLQNITHIKIIDVIGAIDSIYVKRDSKGRKVLDQFPTPFPSGGFDLDAVGAIHIKSVGLDEFRNTGTQHYPNPCINVLNVDVIWEGSFFEILNGEGQRILNGRIERQQINTEHLNTGLYILRIQGKQSAVVTKFLKQ